jgi:hypothetical protein
MQLTLVLFMLVHSYFFCVLKLNDNQPYIVEPGRAKKENNRADHRPQTTDETVPNFTSVWIKELWQNCIVLTRSTVSGPTPKDCIVYMHYGVVLVPTMAGWLDRAIHGPPHDSSSSMAHSLVESSCENEATTLKVTRVSIIQCDLKHHLCVGEMAAAV